MLIVNQGLGGADVFWSDDALMQRHLQHLGNMQRVAASGLLDLFAATEAIGDDERTGRGLARCRQNHQFAYRHGNIVVLFFKTEGAGHAAAT